MERLLCTLLILAVAAATIRSQSLAGDCVPCLTGGDEICGSSPAANVSQECCACLRLDTGGDECRERVESFRNATECCNLTAGPNLSPADPDEADFIEFPSPLNPGDVVFRGPGDYIVRHSHCSCSGCVRDIRFFAQNFTEEILEEIDALQFIIWREYTNGSSSEIYLRISSHSVRLFNESSIGQIQLAGREGLTEMRAELLDRPNGSQSCLQFHPGDVLGFSIARDTLAVVTYTSSEFGEATFLVSNQSACPYLSISSSTDRNPNVPLFDIILELSIPPTTMTEQTTVPPTNPPETTFSTGSPTSMGTTESSTRSTLNSEVPVFAIIVGSVIGLIGLILLAVVIVIIVMVIKFHSTRKTADLTGRRPSFFESFRRGPRRSVSTVMSPRMEGLVNARHQPPTNAETVENHAYDAPIELLGHNYHVLEAPAHGIYGSEGYKYTTMQPPPSETNGQSLTVNFDDDEAYHDPTELGSSNHDQITSKRHTVKNPLYSTSAGASAEMEAFQQQQELHYDEPYELMKDQINTNGSPFYHVLEEPVAPHDHVGGGNKVYRSRSSSIALSLSSDDNTDDGVSGDCRRSNAESMEPSSVTSEGAVNIGSPLNHHYHLLEESTRSQSLNSLSSHHVFDSGVYVPNAEERQQLAGDEGDISAQIYTTWTLAKRQDSSKKKQFFQSSDKYWEPAVAEQQLYDQFHARKFREILRDQIEFKEHLGVGQFGSVCLATLTSQQGGNAKRVAVKTMKPSAQKDAKVKFLQEAAIMGQFFHSNVIKLFGVVTVGEPVMVVMELMALGDLANYLTKNYKPGMFNPPHPKTLLSFSRQVACGMKYLSKKSFVHRDLAARNILVSETLVCKIGDFGMSRNLKESEYYISSGGTVPIKWTAPEALNYKRYSTASDVYSYGMVLYEVWSLARKPLPDVAIPNVARMVSEGYCQPPPPGCPRKIYEIMVQCWNPSHEDRLTFSKVFDTLNTSDDPSLLAWSKEDREVSPKASELGSPLSASWDLYLDLQLTHRRNKQQEEDS